MWALQADDKEQETERKEEEGIYTCTYLLSYIWFATKENKWEGKKNQLQCLNTLKQY
jgi:hypothetical protein